MIKYKQSLSLIVPLFNEEENIAIRFAELNKVLKPRLTKYKIIFVNDGSSDNSLDALKKIHAKNKKVTQIITYTKNQGRGNAIKKGFEAAMGDWIGYADSDLEIRPEYLLKCLDCLDKKECEGVIVSKNLPESEVETTFKRRTASKLFNFWARLVLNSKVHDHQAGMKVFKKKVIKDVLPATAEKGWLFDVELLYFVQQKGYKVMEVPIKVKYGFKKFNKSMVGSFLKSLWYVVKLRYGKE